jgi:hypothetical protein
MIYLDEHTKKRKEKILVYNQTQIPVNYRIQDRNQSH